MQLLWYYLFVINLLTFIIRGVDKWRARINGIRLEQGGEHRGNKNVVTKRRISEKTLLIMSVMGGWLGAYIGMNVFRHKTLKGSFLWKFWLIVSVWIVVLVWVLLRYR